MNNDELCYKKLKELTKTIDLLAVDSNYLGQIHATLVVNFGENTGRLIQYAKIDESLNTLAMFVDAITQMKNRIDVLESEQK